MLREQKADESIYRYGYQGQFSEQDLETGWNHFELREYDPVIGRWLVPDPYGEFWSPYVAMGNDPINLTDPTGGSTDCPKCDAADGQWGALADQYAASAGVSFDVEILEYDFAGTFPGYQQAFPEFAGMSQAQAVAHWNEKYSQDFYRQWRESVQREKDRENVAKLAWFIQGFTTAGAMSIGAMAGSSLPSTRGFHFKGGVPNGISSIEDVMAYPQLLKGKSPNEIRFILGNAKGWRVETLGKGSQQGNGFVLREYNAAGNKTGRMLRWHPGGGHHGPEPYWRVIDYNGGKGGIIR